MGLDTRVFVCICLLATLHTHSTRGYSLYSHLLYRACCNACNDRCGSRRTIGQQRLGHDLVLGLAGGNGAPPGAVGVGVCHWRHGRVGCQASAATSAGLGSSGTCRGGVTNSEEQLCIWLCIWCVFASKTKTHRYTRICTPHPVYFPPRVCSCLISADTDSMISVIVLVGSLFTYCALHVLA